MFLERNLSCAIDLSIQEGLFVLFDSFVGLLSHALPMRSMPMALKETTIDCATDQYNF